MTRIPWFLRQRGFWATSGAWAGGLFLALTLALGLASWRDAFVNEPLQIMLWLVALCVVGGIFGALKCLADAGPGVEERLAEYAPGPAEGWSER